MAKPMLDDEKLGGFAKAVASGDESEETKLEAEKPAGSSASPSSGTETPETPAPKGGEETKAETVEEEAKGPIPYERFREVNEERKNLLARQAESEKKLADMDQQARSQAIVYLQQIAAEHPELRPAIYGETPAKESAEAKPGEESPEKQPITILEKEVSQLKSWKAEQERRVILDDLEGRCEDEMKKHQVFGDATLRNIGERLIVNGLGSTPNVPPEQVVAEVAGLLRGYQEKVKAEYVKTKSTASKTVPVGAGSGGAMPPGGEGKKKLSLDDGTARNALAAALRGHASE